MVVYCTPLQIAETMPEANDTHTNKNNGMLVGGIPCPGGNVVLQFNYATRTVWVFYTTLQASKINQSMNGASRSYYNFGIKAATTGSYLLDLI